MLRRRSRGQKAKTDTSPVANEIKVTLPLFASEGPSNTRPNSRQCRSEQRHFTDEGIAYQPRCLLAACHVEHLGLDRSVEFAKIDQTVAITIIGCTRFRYDRSDRGREYAATHL